MIWKKPQLKLLKRKKKSLKPSANSKKIDNQKKIERNVENSKIISKRNEIKQNITNNDTSNSSNQNNNDTNNSSNQNNSNNNAINQNTTNNTNNTINGTNNTNISQPYYLPFQQNNRSGLYPVIFVKHISPAGKAELDLMDSNDQEYLKIINAGYEAPKITSNVIENYETAVSQPVKEEHLWKPLDGAEKKYVAKRWI